MSVRVLLLMLEFLLSSRKSLVHKRDLLGNLQVGDRVQFLVSSHPRRSEQGDQNRIRASRVKKVVLLQEHDAAEAPAGEAGALSRLCG